MNGSFRTCAIVAALASGIGAAACDGGSGGSSVSGNDLHPVTDDEAKRLERAAAEPIVQRLQN
ncbi:MAG: hypothetical protein ACJ73V_01080 [Acidimicrobiia bacterium]